MSVDWIPDARIPGGMVEERNSGSETPRWKGGGEDSGRGRHQDGMTAERTPGGTSVDWIPDVRHPGGMAEVKNSGRETPEWNGGAKGFRE